MASIRTDDPGMLLRVYDSLRGAWTVAGVTYHSNEASGWITAPKIIMLDKPKAKG